VLDKKVMTWFKNKGDKKPAGSRKVYDILNVQRMDSRVSKEPHTFRVVTTTVTILFSAENEADCEKWISSLKLGISQN